MLERHLGLVGDNFNKAEVIARLKGQIAIGHNRYSTTGDVVLRNVQPFYADIDGTGFAIGHNGNLTNARALRQELSAEGALFQATSDTEVILHLVARSRKHRIVDRLIDALGIGTSAIHLELKVDGTAVRVIELNARTAGGYITTHLIGLSRGVDMLVETLAAVCGLRAVNTAPEPTLHVGSRQHLVSTTGYLRGVNGLDAVLDVPGVANVFLDGRLGQAVGQPPVDFTGSVICSVLAVAGAREDVERILLETDALIRVDVQ